MKKMNKKGFTIVELVIVIAVIAILAAVLIPTFSGVVDKANKSAALQEARAALTCVIAMNDQGKVTDGTVFVCGSKQEYQIVYKNSKLDESNSGIVDQTPNTVIISSAYVDMNDANTNAASFVTTATTDKVTGGEALLRQVLGYENTTGDDNSVTYTVTLVEGVVTIKAGDTVKAKFNLKVSSDFSKNVVAVVPGDSHT